MVPAAPSLTPVEICRFLCGIAWADQQVTSGERGYILNLAQLLGLSPGEVAEVGTWLDSPSDADMFVPAQISLEDRVALVQQAMILASVDGTVDASEDKIIAAVEDLFEISEAERLELRRGVQHLFG